MRENIILCGVGGQGTVLASKLISAAAMAKGIPVMSAETIGMAQRGGSVFSHLRLGEDLYSPMVARGEADLILGFEPGEAVRMLPYLKPTGKMVVSTRAVTPVTASLGEKPYSGDDMIRFLREHVQNLVVVDAEKAMRDLGSDKVLNLILLGAALQADALDLEEKDICAAIREKIPARFHDLNFRALAYARETAAGAVMR